MEPTEVEVFGDELDVELGIDPEVSQQQSEFALRTRRSYDWPAIKARYVEGVKNGETTLWPTLDQSAEHFGVLSQRVREKAAQEGWRQQRNDYQARLTNARQQARADTQIRAGQELDTKALNAAQLGVQLCITRLQEIGETARANRARGPGGRSGVDAREMDALAKATDLWHRIGLRSLGDVETSRLEITGANGQPIEIGAELGRDNPARLGGVLAVLEQAGLSEFFAGARVIDGSTDGGHAAIEAGS